MTKKIWKNWKEYVFHHYFVWLDLLCMCIVSAWIIWLKTKSWRIPYLTVNLILFPMVAFKLYDIIAILGTQYSACIPDTSTYTLTPGHEKPFTLRNGNQIHFKAFDNAVGLHTSQFYLFLYSYSHSFQYLTTGKCLVVHIMWFLWLEIFTPLWVIKVSE